MRAKSIGRREDGLLKTVPLGDPIRAWSRGIVGKTRFKRVNLGLEFFNSRVDLKLREAFIKNRLDVVLGVGFE